MSTAAAPLVRLREVRKSYKRGGQQVPVLAGISFDIAAGEFLALMGPSGSGKSTLLNLIAGIDRADSGELIVAGENILLLDEAALADWRARHIGFIFQFYNLMPVLDARENVALPLLLTDLSRRERYARAEFALQMVGLGDRMQHRPNELSGGQQQRVAIARAHGFQRTGSRIQERVEQIARRLFKTTEEAGGTFYWPLEVEPCSELAFRWPTNDDSTRGVEEICEAELLSLARLVLQRGHSGQDTLIAMARELGLQRLREASRSRLELALTKAQRC